MKKKSFSFENGDVYHKPNNGKKVYLVLDINAL